MCISTQSQPQPSQPQPQPSQPQLTIKRKIDPDLNTITPLIQSLYNIGWPTPLIVKHLLATTHSSFHKVKLNFMVKGLVLSFPPQLSDVDLINSIPFNRIIDPNTLPLFKHSIYALTKSSSNPTSPLDNCSLSTYNHTLIEILSALGWPNTRISNLFHVSQPYVSLISSTITPWSVDELTELFPEMFTSTSISTIPKEAA